MTFDALFVSAFWAHAHGITWTEWCSLEDEQRGIVITASLAMYPPEVEEEEIPEPEPERAPYAQPVLEKIPGMGCSSE